MSNDATEGYQFTIQSGVVTGVTKIKHGYAQFDPMEMGTSWTYDGATQSVSKTEWEDGRQKVTVYTDANGDGLFFKTQVGFADAAIVQPATGVGGVSRPLMQDDGPSKVQGASLGAVGHDGIAAVDTGRQDDVYLSLGTAPLPHDNQGQAGTGYAHDHWFSPWGAPGSAAISVISNATPETTPGSLALARPSVEHASGDGSLEIVGGTQDAHAWGQFAFFH